MKSFTGKEKKVSKYSFVDVLEKVLIS